MVKFSRLHVKNISKRRQDKLDLSGKMDALKEASFRQKMGEALAREGRVYAWYDKKDLIACFLFTKTEEEISLPYVEGADLLKEEREEKEGEKKAAKSYCLVDFFILPEYAEHADKMKEHMLADLKEQAIFSGVDAIKWGEDILRKKSVKVKGIGEFSGIVFGLCIGFIFGIALDNVAIGICFGVCFASCGGLIWSDAGTRFERSGEHEGEKRE